METWAERLRERQAGNEMEIGSKKRQQDREVGTKRQTTGETHREKQTLRQQRDEEQRKAQRKRQKQKERSWERERNRQFYSRQNSPQVCIWGKRGTTSP